MIFFDYVCGCRMHCAYICFLGCLDDITITSIDYIFYLCYSFMFVIELLDFICINNRISYLRLRGIGILDIFDIQYCSISGILARSVGFLFDVRLYCCYELYSILNFDYVYSTCGDSQDRFILRIYDMKNSVICLQQLLTYLNTYMTFTMFEFFVTDLEIEGIIYLFYMMWGINVVGISFVSTEAPKGEYGCCILLYNLYCSRCRIRCADYIHVLLLNIMCKGFLLCDLVALIGNVDVVFGSVDR